MAKTIMRRLWILAFSLPGLGFGQVTFEPQQERTAYSVLLDLTAVAEDSLPVKLITPRVAYDSIEFVMPRIIPGTYDIHDYGRFIGGLEALDQEGSALPVKRLDTNRWLIKQARRLYQIHYRVADSYDYPENTGIFEPAGTSHEADSVFLLNNFGYIGYLRGHKDLSYRVHIEKPRGFYASTALSGELSPNHDIFAVDDYFDLHDNPILYCRPDTAWHQVANTQVLVSVFSPNGLVTAQECKEEIVRVLDATAGYLGDSLPTNKYAVLIYTIPMDQMGSSYGALEHHSSTVLYLPEMPTPQFYDGVRDITAHEFFHIITPLGIHSEQIADFDFLEPEMSEHIWLYEGVTEYNSHLVQAQGGIYQLEEFLEVLKGKMKSADRYDEHVPLTQASRHTLTFFKDQYLNFYQKGALAALALDLKLVVLSEGNYRLVDLLIELGRIYGPDTFFVDDNLFSLIAETSGYPELEEFLARHIAGTDPFPFEELFAAVGITYQAEYSESKMTLGGIGLGFNFKSKRLAVADTSDINSFGRALGFQMGDEIISINGKKLEIGNLGDLTEEFYANTKEGDKVKVEIARPLEDDSYREMKLKAKAQKALVTRKHRFQIQSDPGPEKLVLRQSWLGQS